MACLLPPIEMPIPPTQILPLLRPPLTIDMLSIFLLVAKWPGEDVVEWVSWRPIQTCGDFSGPHGEDPRHRRCKAPRRKVWGEAAPRPLRQAPLGGLLPPGGLEEILKGEDHRPGGREGVLAPLLDLPLRGEDVEVKVARSSPSGEVGPESPSRLRFFRSSLHGCKGFPNRNFSS
jgi:hypothetical protein